MTPPETPGAGGSPVPLRLGLSVAVVLLFLPWVYEVREAPRQYLVELLALAALARAAIVQPRRLFSPSAPLLAVAALLLASALAPHPWRSLVGAFPHGDSALEWIGYVVLIACAPPARELPRWIAALAALGVAQALLAAVQVGALDAAPTGTLGHPVFLAALCMLASCAAMGALLDARGRWPTILAGFATIACLGAVGLTGRRGPMLALAAVVPLLLLHPNRRRLAKWLAVAGAVALVTSLAIDLPGGSSPAARWLGTQDSVDSVAERIDLYRVGLPALLEHPWLGWGFGSFRDLYAQHKAAWNPHFEGRAHNVLLEIGLGAGLLGLAAFLAALFIAGRAMARRVKASLSEPDGGRRLACAAAGVAYLVHLLLNFDQPAVGLWAASLVGLGLAPVEPLATTTTEATSPTVPRWRIAVVTAAALLAALVLAAPMATNLQLGLGIRAERAGDVQGALARYRAAAATAPSDCQAELHAVALIRATEPDPLRSFTERVELLRGCLRASGTESYAHYHLGLALMDGAALDPKLGLEAEAEFRRALELIPHQFDFLRGLARALVWGAKFDEALRALDEAIAQDPSDAKLHNDKGSILFRLGRLEEAVACFERAVEAEDRDPLYRRNLERARAQRDKAGQKGP
ncbi:MAG: O-antigen ligase family protein [Myxococcales bacterium]